MQWCTLDSKRCTGQEDHCANNTEQAESVDEIEVVTSYEPRQLLCMFNSSTSWGRWEYRQPVGSPIITLTNTLLKLSPKYLQTKQKVSSGIPQIGCHALNWREEMKVLIVFLNWCPSLFLSQIWCPSLFLSQIWCPSLFLSQIGCPSQFLSQIWCPSLFLSQIGCPSLFLS